MLGREASYAGTSFVPAAGIGSLRYGSEHVNVMADATLPEGLGSYRWDDEGVEGQRVPIVADGVLAGFLSSPRDAPRRPGSTAPAAACAPTASRASRSCG